MYNAFAFSIFMNSFKAALCLILVCYKFKTSVILQEDETPHLGGHF